jgi:hypothetical protein
MTASLDVTDMIVGRMTEDGFRLSLNEEEIGGVHFKQGTPQFHLNAGYTASGFRVFKLQEKDPSEARSYVYDCDKGWC